MRRIKIILVDFSQIVISSSVDYFSKTREEFDMNLLRHIALNTLLSLKDKLNKYSDEVVLCMDGRNYWRKEIHPHYKANRKASQAKDKFKWDEFFQLFNQLKTEFKENLPYKCVEVERAEADDVISVLTRINAPHRPVVILSSDKDFLQLSSISSNVKQYSPLHKKFLDASGYNLFEHVIKGDDNDGIPNIFSDPDTFMVEGKRQTPVRTTALKEWVKTGFSQPEVFCKSTQDLERFEMNRRLIDLSLIPDDVVDSIVSAYNASTVDKTKLFSYLVKNRLKKILERANF